MRYLLDANAFIEPFRRYYPFDIVPAYWQLLSLSHDEEIVFSIDSIRRELLDIKDELSDWVKTKIPEEFFVESTSEETQARFAEIADWVNNHPVFARGAKDDFLAKADGWLIAEALQNGYTIVTQEALKEPNTKKHVAIPNVCNQFAVPWIPVFELLRRLNAQFLLSE